MRVASSSIALIVALLAPLYPDADAAAVSTTVVISEFRTRGPNPSGPYLDEFVELYNLSASPVSLGGWQLWRSNNAGVDDVITWTSLPPVVLNPGCHYLLATPRYTDHITGRVTPDFFYSPDLTIEDDGGLALLDATLTIVDQVGMSAGSAYKEGTVLAPLTTAVDRGYERKPGGALGSGQDTDDNASDFQLIQPTAPQTLASPCITFPTAIESGSWGAVKSRYW